ncbi:MAG: UDP-3-O-(3-hydroxymyristoyl)glucosamine N-acyltransferase [candidate division Zixibacteria bacterium]|nr:UDP-3-O-(3-hydroxymyristoyl)glucosamine N-acyltransferase [candidate division Zixibacteria bacterium]
MRRSRNSCGLTLAELAARVGGTVEGDSETIIRSVAPVETAGPDQISFIANDKYFKFIATTKAGALILAPAVSCEHVPVLRHGNPYYAFALVGDLLYPDEPLTNPGIAPTAVVHPDAHVHSSARIGPHCHVDRGATIGGNSQLMSSVYIGPDVSVGDECLLYPGVKIMRDCQIGQRVILHPGVVIGSDGFGFAEHAQGLKKIKQVGWVEIADDVEIGANTTVDRGAIGPTRIGRGTKIDNLVQVAHNVEIGENCIIIAQVGISGSTKIGNGVVLAGQVGLVGHIEVGDGAQVGAQSGVSKSIPPGKKMFGCPAREIMETKRIDAALRYLPELLKRVRKLESKSGDDSAD